VEGSLTNTLAENVILDAVQDPASTPNLSSQDKSYKTNGI
jgi:hypothetical protein